MSKHHILLYQKEKIPHLLGHGTVKIYYEVRSSHRVVLDKYSCLSSCGPSVHSNSLDLRLSPHSTCCQQSYHKYEMSTVKELDEKGTMTTRKELTELPAVTRDVQ